MNVELDHLNRWIGRSILREDIITPRMADNLATLFDEDAGSQPGNEAPIGIHWCLCPDLVGSSKLGTDGHPARGDFLPPVPLPRRMWAGGDLTFTGKFHVGDAVRRTSTITDIAMKAGRSGQLCFVSITHDYATAAGSVLKETQTIVFREFASPSTAEAESLPAPDRWIAVNADSVLLFRYSAATLNAHRIHYDRNYCIEVERYSGLLVHGPLQATYLLRIATEINDGFRPERFDYRGVSSLFDQQVISANGRRTAKDIDLWIADSNGKATMRATAFSSARFQEC